MSEEKKINDQELNKEALEQAEKVAVDTDEKLSYEQLDQVAGGVTYSWCKIR